MALVAAFYYTQTGQGLEILRSMCRPLEEAGHRVVYKEIVPVVRFPLPWSADAFFQAFPECRQGIACPIRPMDLADVEGADLVILSHPVWFLSPSMPVHGFFQTEAIRSYLRGKPVVAVSGCRNMWVMAQEKIRSYLSECGSRLVGSVVLQDRHANLVSVITTVRWLIYGKKEKTGWLPAAGVSQEDIDRATVFGRVLDEALHASGFSALQERLMQHQAIDYQPDMVFVERTGHRIFGVWSRFILRKGAYLSPQRAFRLVLFRYYLVAVLYLVSPIGLLFFYLSYPFRYRSIRKAREKACSLL
jgi:hypothetical protein